MSNDCVSTVEGIKKGVMGLQSYQLHNCMDHNKLVENTTTIR